MTKLALLIAGFVMASASKDPLNERLKGDYAFSVSRTCAGAAKSQSVNGEVFTPYPELNWNLKQGQSGNTNVTHFEGTTHFNGDGTGTSRGTYLQIVNQPMSP